MERTCVHVGKLLPTELVIAAVNICRGLQWTDGGADSLLQARERELGVIVAVALILLSMFFFYSCDYSRLQLWRACPKWLKMLRIAFSNPFTGSFRVNGRRKINFTPENVVEVILVGPHNLEGLLERFKAVESG